MKHRRYIWFCAAVFVLAALGIGLARREAHRAQPPTLSEKTATALAFLEADPAAGNPETQDAARSVAALAAEMFAAGQTPAPETCYVLGIQYQREENARAAEDMFRRVIAERPQWNRGYEGLGALLGQPGSGAEDEAEDLLRKAIALAPESGRAHNLLALLLRGENRIEEAQAEALEALRLMPDDVAAHNNYANLLVVLGRYDEARTHYEKALELDPSHPKPYYNLACLHAIEGRTDAALEQLSTALQLAPEMRRDAEFDIDLDNLRGTAEFNQIVYGTPAPPPAPEQE